MGSKAIEITPIQVQFLDSADAKVTIEADGASTIWFKGDDGAETAFLKNCTLIRNRVEATSSPYAVPTDVDRVGILNTGEANPFYVDLPAASSALNGRAFRLKDEAGNAGSFPIHIRPNGAETVDGATTLILNVNYQGITVYCNGTVWFGE